MLQAGSAPFLQQGAPPGEMSIESILASAPPSPQQSLALLPACPGQGQADVPRSTCRHCGTSRAKGAGLLLPLRHTVELCPPKAVLPYQ